MLEFKDAADIQITKREITEIRVIYDLAYRQDIIENIEETYENIHIVEMAKFMPGTDKVLMIVHVYND